MPKGKPLANMMDNEVVEVLYTCMKHGQNGVDFNEVAKELGLKDASTAYFQQSLTAPAQRLTFF